MIALLLHFGHAQLLAYIAPAVLAAEILIVVAVGEARAWWQHRNKTGRSAPSYPRFQGRL